MMRILLAAALATAWGLAVGPAGAQPAVPRPQTNPYMPPAFSPFLNLRGGGNPAINYFGIVQPQLEFQQQLRALQLQQGALGAAMDDPTGAALAQTGHPSQFGNYGHYFGPPGGNVRPLTLPPAGFGAVRRQ
jgi:hypothetical protein